MTISAVRILGAISVVALGRADGDDGVLGDGDGALIRGGEWEPAGFRVPRDKLAECWFVKRHVIALELSKLLAVDVDHGDVVSKVRQAGGSRESDIAGADDSNFAQIGAIISVRYPDSQASPPVPKPASDSPMRV